MPKRTQFKTVSEISFLTRLGGKGEEGRGVYCLRCQGVEFWKLELYEIKLEIMTKMFGTNLILIFCLRVDLAQLVSIEENIFVRDLR